MVGVLNQDAPEESSANFPFFDHPTTILRCCAPVNRGIKVIRGTAPPLRVNLTAPKGPISLQFLVRTSELLYLPDVFGSAGFSYRQQSPIR